MSDRLFLGIKPMEWADVNLSDHATLEAAIQCFQEMPGPHKVFGTAQQIAACCTEWERLFRSDEMWLDPEMVGWRTEEEK